VECCGLRRRLRCGGSVLRWVFWFTIVAMCALTFVWPFTVSADPANPAFKVAAIATLLAFLVSLAALLTAGLRRSDPR
jgi:membrane protease YdiL (CAAX protease family)